MYAHSHSFSDTMNLMYEDRDETGLRTTGMSPLHGVLFPARYGEDISSAR